LNSNDSLIILGDDKSNLYWIDSTDPKNLKLYEPKNLYLSEAKNLIVNEPKNLNLNEPEN